MSAATSIRVSVAALSIACLAPGAARATFVDAASAMNATMTESTVELSSILASMNRKIHNGESFDFGQRSWSGAATADSFWWNLTGVYDGRTVEASANGVYHVPDKDHPTARITWTTELKLGGEKVSSIGENLLSADDASPVDAQGADPVQASKKRWSWKNAWKKVTQVATWVKQNWVEIKTIAEQALTVIALPNPVTVVVQAVSSAGTIVAHRAIEQALPGALGAQTVVIEDDVDVGVIDFGAQLGFRNLATSAEVTSLQGDIDARLMVENSYHDRLARGSISGQYQSPTFVGSATLGQADEPGAVALAVLALALLAGASRFRKASALP